MSVPVLRKVILTPGITAFAESVTRPVTVARSSCPYDRLTMTSASQQGRLKRRNMPKLPQKNVQPFPCGDRHKPLRGTPSPPRSLHSSPLSAKLDSAVHRNPELL